MPVGQPSQPLELAFAELVIGALKPLRFVRSERSIAGFHHLIKLRQERHVFRHLAPDGAFFLKMIAGL
jgi:hypothetical protein